jgi:hypothetical protein
VLFAISELTLLPVVQEEMQVRREEEEEAKQASRKHENENVQKCTDTLFLEAWRALCTIWQGVHTNSTRTIRFGISPSRSSPAPGAHGNHATCTSGRHRGRKPDCCRDDGSHVLSRSQAQKTSPQLGDFLSYREEVGAYRACGAGECLKVHRRYVEEWVTNVATVQVPGTKNWETAMSLDESAAGNLYGNWRSLGTIWLVYVIYRVIVGICLVLFSGTATVMFGALLSRVPDPFALMGDFHIIYVCIVVLTLLSGLFGLLAGMALLANRRSAHALALVASFLSVSEIPFGTTLGIYTLIILLPVVGATSVRRA